MNSRLSNVVAFAVVAVLLAGCDTIGTYEPAPPTGKSLSALKTADGCDEVLELMKQETIEQMEARLDESLGWALEMVEYGCMMYAMDAGTGGPPPGPTQTNGGGEEGGAKEYSETNTQVEGVDEADFIKNDGSYIYIVADGMFQVIDAWPAPNTAKIATFEIEGEPKRMYVHGDRAAIYSALGPIPQPSNDYYGYGGGWGMTYQSGGGDCTYGYDCDFTGDGQILKVTVLDIEDRSNPELLREIEFSGSYLNSRRIADIVHTVVVFPEVSVPGLEYWPGEFADYWDWCWEMDDFPYSEQEVKMMFQMLKIENTKKIKDASITEFLPGIKDTRYVGDQVLFDEGLLGDCQGFYLSQAGDGSNILSLISFELDEQDEIGISTVVGRPGAVYASHDALFIAERHYAYQMNTWYFPESEGINEATTIHKFALKKDSIQTEYRASGAVKGRVLNQFSMDEQDGFLRMATTNGRVPSPDVYSTLAILKEYQGEMVVTGMADHIAPTEDIRSARFNGDVGFIVTFKKTDPLFVIDLSDPYHPQIKGELKIPGYSTYMHILDDKHLLAIGYEADDQGSFAWFTGIQLQIFDVSVMENPQLIHKEVIGTRGSTSDAATDHLAFNYFRARELLAVPIVICEGGSGGGSYGTSMTFTGLLVYKATAKDGFQLQGGIPHAPPDFDSNACGNWWTQSNSHVKRSVFMSDDDEDWVYSVAMDKIQVSNLLDLDHPVSSVHLVDK